MWYTCCKGGLSKWTYLKFPRIRLKKFLAVWQQLPGFRSERGGDSFPAANFHLGEIKKACNYKYSIEVAPSFIWPMQITVSQIRHHLLIFYQHENKTVRDRMQYSMLNKFITAQLTKHILAEKRTISWASNSSPKWCVKMQPFWLLALTHKVCTRSGMHLVIL